MSIVSNHYPEVLDEINSQTEEPRKRVRKPRPKPERRIRLALKPFGKAPGVVEITVGKEKANYFLTEISADFGRGFKVEKMGTDGEPEAYHVNIDGDNRRCSCKGHSRWSHCKHSDGLAALVKAGQLTDTPQLTGA